MNLQAKIEKLQAELNFNMATAAEYANTASALAKQLDALKAEASKPQGFKMWEPTTEGEKYWFPNPIDTDHSDWYNLDSEFNCAVLERGLAFRTQEAAARVGKWLAVMGKLANLAMQMNEGEVFGEYFYVHNFSDDGSCDVSKNIFSNHHMPRFHSRTAAEQALSLLSADEKQTLVSGIA